MEEKNLAPNFIRDIIRADQEKGTFSGRVQTRFPPEPNGYLHIGHAKAICLNFSLAEEFGGICNLRFDDTNPSRAEEQYIDAIQRDIRWLGFEWQRTCYASDYFDQLYQFAVQLIQANLAYVDHQSAEEMRSHRGTLTEPGINSPYRERKPAENLLLFQQMRAGRFAPGECVLRARIDMAASNINLRDPVLYRIQSASHPRTGKKWCIYPLYDWAHGQSDSLEGVTHSLCSLEFENHRPLYDWFLHQLSIHHPKQIEFARLNMSHTLLSKRMLRRLVEEGHVSGWDDPRMPTLSGLRRRGYSPHAIRNFCEEIGVSRRNSSVDWKMLEHVLRQDLNHHSPRAMAVLSPLRIVIENYPEDVVETFTVPKNPEQPDVGTRTLPFSRELYIERGDFMEEPPRKFFRLAPGREVRLRAAYLITCHDVIKDEGGNVVELRCRYDPETRGGNAPEGRRVKATLHWVSVPHAQKAEVRMYENLFTRENPLDAPAGKDFIHNLNPNSLNIRKPCFIEPGLAVGKAFTRYQFERLGYFCVDPDSTGENPIFNRTVTLRDEWARLQRRTQQRT
ncbi:MAG: glutamine--tRNA ligase/YqeY domain fusion protein [Anaerolineaceae bacterium]|nr:glutamine--tRNA ligase/YqeY domain fusion protein [Anaerolineaceae bacterium]